MRHLKWLKVERNTIKQKDYYYYYYLVSIPFHFIEAHLAAAVAYHTQTNTVLCTYLCVSIASIALS